MSDQLLAHRYRVLRTLGSGGMGVVLLVEDTRRDNRIMALKTMQGSLSEAGTESFRDEFRNIVGVVHPNIPEVYDFGVLPPPEPSLFFTSEFVEGEPLDHLSMNWNPAQLHEILVSLCRALAFLHSRGLLHRDLKPQNVLGRLDAQGVVEMVKLVDFGLAVRTGENVAAAGTVDYMAPELIEGHNPSVASDLYAAGMLLYRLATGRLPFEAGDPLAVARQRCNDEAPPPLRFRPDLPVGLSDVISALIRIKPGERPPSARHVIALLNEREGTDFPYETPLTRHAYIRSAAAVTNVHERTELRRRARQIKMGAKPVNVVVTGQHGVGRKRLLRDFAHELAVDGVRVCLMESEPDHCTRCSTQAVVIPDAGRLSRTALRQALAIAAECGAWCVIGTLPSETELSAELGPHDILTLRPLDERGVAAFVAATFPENTFPASFTARLYSGTLGCAAALHDALTMLLEDGTLRIGLKGWELLPGAWQIALHPAAAVQTEQTLGELPDHARRLAYHLACSPSPLPRALLRHVLPDGECDESNLADAVQHLKRTGWLASQGGEYTMAFSAVADYLKEILDDATLREIHGRLADAWSAPAMEGHARRQRERLYHDARAGRWSIPADEAARTLNAALTDGDQRWIRHFAETCLKDDIPPAMAVVLLDALAHVEYVEGDWEAADAHLAASLDNGTVAVTNENLERMARFAMIEEKLGRTERAEAILEKCLRVLPEGHDVRAGIVYGTAAWIAFKRGSADRARKLAEDGLLRVPPHAADPGHALLLNTVASLAFYRGDSDAASMYWKRCLEINEAVRDRRGVANIYNNLGVLAAQRGDRLRARELWKKCAEIAEEIRDVHRLAGIYNNLGVDALETGALAEAEEFYLKALAIFRRIKSPREQVEILSNLGELSYYRADFPRAHSYLQEAVTLASTLEDFECEIEPLIYLGKLLLTLEELEGAAAVLERAFRAAHEVGARKGQLQAWEGIALLRARRGRWQGATEALEKARSLLSDDVEPLARLHFHLTECAVAAEAGDSQAAQTALQQAQQVADTKWDPFAAARALVYGLLFAQQGLDARERSRVARQLSVYPDLLWRFHWASARGMIAQGAVRRALDEFGRGAAVLKAIAGRLSEQGRERFLASPQIRRFKEEAISLRKSVLGS